MSECHLPWLGYNASQDCSWQPGHSPATNRVSITHGKTFNHSRQRKQIHTITLGNAYNHPRQLIHSPTATHVTYKYIQSPRARHTITHGNAYNHPQQLIYSPTATHTFTHGNTYNHCTTFRHFTSFKSRFQINTKQI